MKYVTAHGMQPKQQTDSWYVFPGENLSVYPPSQPPTYRSFSEL